MNNRLKNWNRQSPEQSYVAPGSFLIAAPGLQNTPFQKTVIFVLQNNEHGTFGAVLNRPADPVDSNAWQTMTGLEFGSRSIMKGGPIGGPVFAIHQQKSLAELEMPGGICVSADQEVFQKLVDQTDSDFRIVLGIAGWQYGQLTQELLDGNWYHLEADPQHLFDDPAWMWESFLRQYGRQQWERLIGIKHIPANPWLN